MFDHTEVLLMKATPFNKIIPLRPLRQSFDISGIIRKLQLRRPIYGKTALEGHFGVSDRPWEQTDLVPELKKLAGI